MLGHLSTKKIKPIDLGPGGLYWQLICNIYSMWDLPIFTLNVYSQQSLPNTLHSSLSKNFIKPIAPKN